MIAWLYVGPPGGTRVGMGSVAAREMAEEVGERIPCPYCSSNSFSAKSKEVSLPCTVKEEMTRAGKSGKYKFKCLSWTDSSLQRSGCSAGLAVEL